MKHLCIVIFLTLHFSSYGQVTDQTISKRKAIRIAKTDSFAKMKRIESTEMVLDPASNTLCWSVLEKINVNRELDKIFKSKRNGMTNVYADKIILNAYTGDVVSREKIWAGSIHIAPDF